MKAMLAPVRSSQETPVCLGPLEVSLPGHMSHDSFIVLTFLSCSLSSPGPPQSHRAGNTTHLCSPAAPLTRRACVHLGRSVGRSVFLLYFCHQSSSDQFVVPLLCLSVDQFPIERLL